MRITATYSPEDNKLRLYASQRLDSETYARVKAAGFKWAPRQELFVAPAWSFDREALALELAGEIEAEESTMAERAEAKAERLETLASKRRADANAFSRAAHGLSERFAGGQPILIGHHSERRARKDRERADSMLRKAIDADRAAGWWLYKASAAQHHANRKNAPGVRARRIKTLLSELRDLQRKLNHYAFAVKLLDRDMSDSQIEKLAGARSKEGEILSWEADTRVRKGESTWQQEKAAALEHHESALENPRLHRWISHTLNRLSYERELLGEVARWTGEVTPVMLQEFTREHGADTPNGSREPDGRLTVKSIVPLPAHIGNGAESVTLTADEWRDLMQSCGYDAAAKAESKAASVSATVPLLNISPADAPTLTTKNPYYRGQTNTYPVVAMTKAEFAKQSEECRGTYVSICGRFRFRTGLDPNHTGPRYQAPRVAVFLSDSKAHPLPATETAEAAE